jgi:hypothetical protein
MRRRASIERRAQLRNLPLQPVEQRCAGERLACGHCRGQRGLLAGLRPPPVVRLLMPKASHGLCAGFLGPMPCARRQRKERRQARSRRCSGVNRVMRPHIASCQPGNQLIGKPRVKISSIGFSSIRVASRRRRSATRPVVPAPANGSRTAAFAKDASCPGAIRKTHAPRGASLYALLESEALGILQ